MSRYAVRLQPAAPDHYAILGLDPRATLAQIRAAYRLLAKRYHPDLNPDGEDAPDRTRQLNAAHEVLSDPARRRAYDRTRRSVPPARAASRNKPNISRDVHLRVDDFLRGTFCEVTVRDPANPEGLESYRLEVPPLTHPGAKFRWPRDAPFQGGFVEVRLRVRPGFRFRVRGSDLRVDLQISARRATSGGCEIIPGAAGDSVRVQIPARVPRGEVLRIAGEGLPRARGGRGDLLVRIIYRPEVRLSRKGG